MTTNNYIIFTQTEKVKVLTINELNEYKSSIQQLFKVEKDGVNTCDSSQLLISHAKITFVFADNIYDDGLWKRSIRIRIIPITDVCMR